MRILIVEDEEEIFTDLATALETSGYVIEHVSNGQDAWFQGGTESYDAIILDLGLPDLDGINILTRWRREGVTTPVLILTARGSWMDRVDGMDAGADDYLGKPFQMEELLARVRALLRRSSGQANPVLSAGAVTLDTRQKRVSIKGIPLALSPLEYRFLSYMMHQKGRAISQIELTEHIYDQDFERDSNSIEVLVARLRKKIKVDLIQTRRGHGYIIPDDL